MARNIRQIKSLLLPGGRALIKSSKTRFELKSGFSTLNTEQKFLGVVRIFVSFRRISISRSSRSGVDLTGLRPGGEPRIILAGYIATTTLPGVWLALRSKLENLTSTHSVKRTIRKARIFRFHGRKNCSGGLDLPNTRRLHIALPPSLAWCVRREVLGCRKRRDRML